MKKNWYSKIKPTIRFDEDILNNDYIHLCFRTFSLYEDFIILHYASEEIILQEKEGKICIKGKNLLIEQLEKRYIYITGHLNEVQLIKEDDGGDL